MKHTIREELSWVLGFIAILWVIHLVDVILPIPLNSLGLVPRTLSGLIGVPLMPFLHGGWGHLISNTVPLAILLMLLAGSRADSITIVVGLVFLGGGLLWLFGRSSTHIGASGLIYGLILFLIASGLLERRLVPMLIALLVLFLYGGTMLWGALPSMNQKISWDGHLFGAIAGGLLAYLTTTKFPYSEKLTAENIGER
ncbi:MAG: rhomboid family intramembrane serine protease [Pirellulaceae bacterium]|nr:rhomboid family intramembrane serine protease [Pirellulaceae bacterium]